MKKSTCYLSIYHFAILAMLASLLNCGSGKNKERELAERYCGSCHLFPEPSLLPKENWPFSENWFFHITSASKTISFGFDGDGDVDLGTISFFSNLDKKSTRQSILKT